MPCATTAKKPSRRWFRGVNEAYTESTGVINPQTEPLVIAGGDLDVDKFIVSTMGIEQRSVQEAMKIKSLALAWTKAFIKGDSVTDNKTFDGLQARPHWQPAYLMLAALTVVMLCPSPSWTS